MKWQFTLALMCFALLFTGCKKKDNLPVGDTGSSMVKSETYVGAFSSLYFYDSQNRLIKYVSDGILLTLSYNGHSITIVQVDSNQHVPVQKVFTALVNSSGLVDSVIGPAMDGFELPMSVLCFSGEHRTYDADGHLIIQSSPSQTDTFSWANGDQQFFWITYNSNNDNRNFGINAFGKQSTHLVAHMSPDPDSLARGMTFTYTFDSHARVKQTDINDNSQGYPVTGSIIYTYY